MKTHPLLALKENFGVPWQEVISKPVLKSMESRIVRVYDPQSMDFDKVKKVYVPKDEDDYEQYYKDQ